MVIRKDEWTLGIDGGVWGVGSMYFVTKSVWVCSLLSPDESQSGLMKPIGGGDLWRLEFPGGPLR